MKNFEIKRILVPVDFSPASETAVTEATALSKMLNAEIFLLHVLETNSYRLSVLTETQSIQPSIHEFKKMVKEKMQEVGERIKNVSGVTPKLYTKDGHIHSEIINFAEQNNIDIIMMGTHGASGYKEMFIGSNSQRVVTLSNIPVLTIQETVGQPGFKNILVPIDNSMHSREKVNIAMIFAKLFGSRLHILGLPDSEKEEELKKFKIKIESVEKIISAEGLSYQTTMVHGKSLAESAINYASKKNCDLIVINTGHESRITGIFLGAFAQQIVNHSRIPVLSLKHTHDDFVIATTGFGI